MRCVLGNDHATGTRVHSQRKLVGHRAARYKHPSFFAQHPRNVMLERPHRGVVAKQGVANIRVCHRVAHGS